MAEDTREVREQVEEARRQLGDTVAALAYKANAPRRAKERLVLKVDGAKRRISGLRGRKGPSDASR
jgi:hypothetical protein